MRNKIINIIFVIIFVLNIFIPNYIFAENVVNIDNIDKENIKSEKDIFKDLTAPNLMLAETKTGRRK